MKKIGFTEFNDRFKIESIDDQLMLDLFKTASLGGNNKAQHWLGNYYEKIDPEQSERWYAHSAFNQNIEAYQSLERLQSAKFFTKEKLFISGNFKPLDLYSYHNPQGLTGDWKSYARLAYFRKEMTEDSDGFNYDLWFYERWPIKRIAKYCKNTNVEFTRDCIQKYKFGVNFGYTFLGKFLD